MVVELGGYCCVLKIGEVLEIPGATWLDTMIESYPTVSDFVLNRAQIRAWVDEYAVLQKAFRDLPAGYRALDVVFEYVIPQNRPLGEEPDPASWIRPDAVILSEDTVLILEFKQRAEDERYQQRPAQKYRKSIKRYHRASRRMRKRSVLVLTKQRDYLEHYPGLDSCSPDKLATVIRDCLEDDCRPHPDAFAWLASEFGL